jgi:cell division protein ZapA
MAQVSVRINGRHYQVACEDGQEAHLQKLAAYIDDRVSELVRDVGQVGDARLLVMAALLIADELADAYDELEELRGVNTILPAPDPDTVRAAEAARNAAAAAEARAATAEMAAQSALQRLAAFESERQSGDDQIAGAIEALAGRVESLAERLERERA